MRVRPAVGEVAEIEIVCTHLGGRRFVGGCSISLQCAVLLLNTNPLCPVAVREHAGYASADDDDVDDDRTRLCAQVTRGQPCVCVSALCGNASGNGGYPRPSVNNAYPEHSI